MNVFRPTHVLHVAIHEYIVVRGSMHDSNMCTCTYIQYGGYILVVFSAGKERRVTFMGKGKEVTFMGN